MQLQLIGHLRITITYNHTCRENIVKSTASFFQPRSIDQLDCLVCWHLKQSLCEWECGTIGVSGKIILQRFLWMWVIAARCEFISQIGDSGSMIWYYCCDSVIKRVVQWQQKKLTHWADLYPIMYDCRLHERTIKLCSHS